MQAILLCEYFARFRGRKAVTRPSKPFESLYSRVSTLRSFSMPPSSALVEDSGLWLVDTSAWSPVSSSASSDSSFCDAMTPTTAAAAMSPFALQHLRPLQAPASWASFSSPRVRSSVTSPSRFGNTSFSSDPSSLVFNMPQSLGRNLNPNVSPPSNSRSRARPSWSALFASDRHSPASGRPPSLSLTVPLQVPGQTYSQCVANSQVLYQNRALLDHAVLAADRDLQDRWQHWLDAESRRRLFAACYFSDGHAAIYQQQRRTQDTDGALEQVPLLGRSTKLWEASTAEEWVNILAADPGALQPDHIPPLEHLTQEDVLRRPPMDQMIILSVLAQRLPRRQRAHSLSPHTSPSPEMDPHMQYVGSQFNHDQQQQTPFHLFAPHPQADYPLDAEERINTLFPACPIANTYLALHHTPLRDLLAVGGDSWVFSQKVLPATSFLEHQKRLRLWVTATSTTTTTNTPNHSNNHSHSNSNTAPSAASAGNNDVLLATIYASRAILAFLDRELCQPQQNTTAAWSADMSDYWAMYVCALIFWAFCHPVRNGSNGTAGGGIGTEGGVDSPAVSSSVEGTTAAAASAAGGGGRDDEAAAVGWLRMVASASTVGEGPRAVEEVLRLRGRRGAGGVVGLVRRRLEGDCVGGRSRLYVDAVGVLRRIEERDGWKWF